MSVINTNITALIGQQNLGRSQSALQTSMERLSSGLRINSAKDDAAGQAIANRMTSQITGLMQAQRNANDGISVAQTAEGALNQVNENLQRIRELTVQAANETNSSEDLGSIQNEIGQRLEEIGRISDETSFNGVKVLATDNELVIQVGANDDETIKIDLKKITSETLGLTGFNVDGSGEVANDAATADDLVHNGFTTNGTALANGSLAYSKDTVSANAQFSSADLMAKLDNNTTISLGSTSATGFQTHAADADIGYNANTLTYNGQDFTYDVQDVNASSAVSALTPAAGDGPRAATVTIGGADTDVLIQEDGSITNTNNEALYIDKSGNLTATTSGTTAEYANATVENLTAAMSVDDLGLATAVNSVAGTALDLQNTAIETAVIKLTDSGTTFTGQATADGIDVTGAVASKDAVANMLAADGGTVTRVADLTVTDDAGADALVNVFTVAAGGGVTAGETVGNLASGDAIYVSGDGSSLTEETQTTTTTTYYAQESGMVTDNTGQQIYVDSSRALTTDATTEGSRTTDPLAKLDNALSQVDAIRSDLGAIQNRFESAITNLSTTTTNLSAARSRIEDADYAKEVANMTRAQILQQAGTSVLAQANQVPQGVLSLLR